MLLLNVMRPQNKTLTLTNYRHLGQPMLNCNDMENVIMIGDPNSRIGNQRIQTKLNKHATNLVPSKTNFSSNRNTSWCDLDLNNSGRESLESCKSHDLDFAEGQVFGPSTD